ncbi:MAG: pyridoxamine 5'-phosphate oxidase family protein [Alistipes sp.]|nr:pyridoxamine 5'-phosphate oxidase family protein [Alistipes sp.]
MQSNDIDKRFVRFIAKHHVLTLATANSQGEPYVANCFYAYDKERNRFVFTSDITTRHGAEMEAHNSVALSVVLETRVVGRVQGLQVVGRAMRGDDEAKSVYLKRFPYAAVAPLTLWVVEPTMMKLTDNTLGFGTKLIWQSEE